MAKATEDKKELHVHRWEGGYQATEKKCLCGKILVCQTELDRRAEEWHAFYDLVKTTPSYLDFIEMKDAYATRNKPKINEIMARIEAQTHKVQTESGERLDLNEPLLKPSFPDPESGAYIIA